MRGILFTRWAAEGRGILFTRWVEVRGILFTRGVEVHGIPFNLLRTNKQKHLILHN